MMFYLLKCVIKNIKRFNKWMSQPSTHGAIAFECRPPRMCHSVCACDSRYREALKNIHAFILDGGLKDIKGRFGELVDLLEHLQSAGGSS
jgi:hypothetical protein